MSDYLSMSLEDLKKQVIADGIVDADEVRKLRERLYADGKIDHDEAEFVFDINDAVSGKANDASWNELFVQVLCDHVLEDETSPGEIDDEEAAWLLKRIQGDGNFDDAERSLIDTLKQRSAQLPAKLKSLLETS